VSGRVSPSGSVVGFLQAKPLVNVRGLPFVIPDSIPQTYEESMSGPALAE
jgi:hypothetical protein